MPAKKQSRVTERFESLLKARGSHKKEPALRPILIALHLSNFGTTLDTVPDVAAVCQAVRDSIFEWYLGGLDTFGWMRVPCPARDELTSWVERYLKEAKALDEPVLRARDATRIARSIARLAIEMWAVAHYFVLDLLISNAMHDCPKLDPNCLEIGWTGKDPCNPRLVYVQDHGESIFDRLWLEAAIMLGVEAPSKSLNAVLRARVRYVTDGKLNLGAELFKGPRPLIHVRRAEATPFRAIAYVNQVLRRNAAAELVHQKTAGKTRISTLNRYCREGLRRDATDQEIEQHRAEKALRRAHRVETAFTKRQLIRAYETRGFKVSHRKMDNALRRAERQLGKPAPKEGGVLRLDAAWCKQIDAFIRES